MSDPRIVFALSEQSSVILEPRFTIQVDDETSLGIWSKPKRAKLTFMDHNLDGTLADGGGARGGAPGGHPLQLLFWGDWWNGAGMAKRALIEERTKALLDSPYFTGLVQYGIPHAPVWRGSLTVTSESAPSNSNDPHKLTDAVKRMVENLIEDDVFPDPDDGPRILFIVLLPDTLTLGPGFGVGGAHSHEYDMTFPWDDDSFWVGWVGPGKPVDPPVGGDRSVMSTMSHEVVEMLTDPEATAWCTPSPDDGRFEISDAGVSVNASTTERQTAFVNGVHVQSYWSVEDNATIIPIDSGYQAQLRSRIHATGRHISASDRFRPTAEDNRFCSDAFPQCCMADKDYEWRAYAVDEAATITVNTQRYRRTSLSWTINGHSLGDSPTMTVTVQVDRYVGRSLKSGEQTVTLQCRRLPTGLEIKSSGKNFAIDVGCAVRERDITGNVRLDGGGLVATPQITLGFNGSELRYDDDYIRQKGACLAAMIRQYDVQYMPSKRIRPEEGINFRMTDLLKDMPAHVRPSQFAALQWIARAAFASQSLRGAEVSQHAIRQLIAEAPALARNLDVRLLKAEVKSLRRDRKTGKGRESS